MITFRRGLGSGAWGWWLGAGAAIAAGAGLDAASRLWPARMPAIGPYAFSWWVFLAAGLAVLTYARGIARGIWPGGWRVCAFATGIGLIYGVLQTRFDYWAQHMFTLTRVQHLVTHHVGPFLVALSEPGAVLAAGLPPGLRRIAGAGPVRRAMARLQWPPLAAVLFVGLIFVWLIPGVLFRAMLDTRLYALMNASMVADGLLFWVLVLDRDASRLSIPARLLLVFFVQWPQIAGGAAIGFLAPLYPYYAYCGRLFPAVSAQSDQEMGAFLIWFGGGMMSVAASYVLLRRLQAAEARDARFRGRESASLRSEQGRNLPVR